MQATGTRPKIFVSADGPGVVAHAGARLLADVAEATGLARACVEAMAGVRQRRGRHDPGRIVVDLAVMLADGGEAISDLAVLRDQAALFGPVASDPTAWRLLSIMDGEVLGRLHAARAQARTYGLLAHIRGLRDTGVDARFSVGVAITEPIRQAILAMKDRPGDWMPALDGDGEPRDGADICELTGLVPDDGFPAGLLEWDPDRQEARILVPNQQP